MKVTLNTDCKALEKQKKILFAAHIKELKLKDKENTCLSNSLKLQFDHFDHINKKSKLPHFQSNIQAKKFKILKQKCKNINTNTKNVQIQCKKQFSVSSAKKGLKFIFNPETTDQFVKKSLSQLQEQKNKDSNHSTKANSRQKSRATSVESSNNCCNFVKVQKHQVTVGGQNHKHLDNCTKKIKQKKKKICKILSPQITKITRIIMLDWLFQLSAEIQLPRQALYNSIDYIDKVVMQTEIKKSNYQKVGLACLFLATKLQMSSHPRIQIFLQAMDNQLDKNILIETERKIVHTLKFRLNPPTLYQFMTVAMMTIKTFKCEYKNIGWVNDLPSVEKGNQIYHKMHWIMDGVIMEGAIINKFGKDQICLSILYISMLLSIRKSKINASLGMSQTKNSIDWMRHESTAFTQNSLSNFQRSGLFSSEQEHKFNISYECFIRYATTSNKSLMDYQSCISSLQKWKNFTCDCNNFNSQYHEELKHLALAK